jgi:hypothetical protein
MYDIVIYITYAVGYILQREVFRLKHDRAAGVFQQKPSDVKCLPH